MVDTVETRIKLPGEIHRAVKAEAARHGITLAEALGMCVAFTASITQPLSWRTRPHLTASDLKQWADDTMKQIGPP